MKFRKKPVVIEAVQFTKTNKEEIKEFCKNGRKVDDFVIDEKGVAFCAVHTLEGIHLAKEGDWIIKGVKGEFYPCKQDIFEMTYEEYNGVDALPNTLIKSKEERIFEDIQLDIIQAKNSEDFSDGYHTFKELYEFRKMYNAALFNEWAKQGKFEVHKSKNHHEGEECFGGGWFIVVAILPEGQISNHYEMKDWDLFKCEELEKAKYEFDGHTSQDVLKRLKAI